MVGGLRLLVVLFTAWALAPSSMGLMSPLTQ